VLLALLFVAVIVSELVTEIVGQLTPVFNDKLAYVFAYSPYIRLLLIALVPLAALVYTFFTRPRAALPIPSIPIVE
jgi:hypothetical protein